MGTRSRSATGTLRWARASARRRPPRATRSPLPAVVVLVLGLNSSGLVTSVTDPLGRRWSYAYNASEDLTSVTDPMNRVTSYTYGSETSGNPLLANDLLTITKPNAQPGGPDAGDATVNVYNASGQVISQTDPSGFVTSFNYSGLDPATGNGTVTANRARWDHDRLRL